MTAGSGTEHDETQQLLARHEQELLRQAGQLGEALAELRRARGRQLEMKDQFLSHVSHELRSPLASIYGFVSIVRDGLAGELTPEQKEYLSIAIRSIGRLESMIGDLLDVTRAESGRLFVDPGRTSLETVVGEALETVEGKAAAKRIEVGSDLAVGLSPVMADARRVRQILINLLDNAVKFAPINGRVRVGASLGTEDPDAITLTVSDDGPGMTPEAARNLFRQLAQESRSPDEGRDDLGLGLGICKELVERQGGRLWLESEPGKGSAFRFTLPRFSLADLLAPVAVEAGRVRAHLSLLSFTPLAESPSSRRVMVRLLRLAREILGGSVLPDRDLLLPPMGPAVEERAVHVLASADRDGAARMSERLLQRLGAHPDLRDVEFGVRIEELQAESTDPKAGADQLADLIDQAVRQGPVSAGL